MTPHYYSQYSQNLLMHGILIVVDFLFETVFLKFRRVELIVQVPHKSRLDDEIPDDGEEACEAERRANQQHEHAQERDTGIQERKVHKNICRRKNERKSLSKKCSSLSYIDSQTY